MRTRLMTLLTRDHVTTLADVLGAVCLAVGVGLLAGLGSALIATGALILVGSYLAA